ncbi:biotin--[acetyl-CoA-carboxylase] ligase [Parabacteroides pacaensis]|uniref:biotin--[acetyl-CoA-carboxylase] ligase n=1 Tax=Parabacteroides pacaensis TaxID=2086575 RepID=UPI000D10B037|nr:biotin--[acetyl-CoA-carboxylase] ligase [Parabacteroides pacaensis]
MPEIIHLQQTTSTNRYIRERMQDTALEEGSAVYTDFQTAGRGQIGNTWESEKGMNLTFSVVIYPDCIPANAQFLISQIASLSVKELLDRYIRDVTVKWPNDIYWQDKKICGMLIENDLCGKTIYCSILGIGINLNQETFHGDALNPVSLTQITGNKYDIEKELHAFLEIFYKYYLLLLKGEFETIRQRYKEALYRSGAFHAYEDSTGRFHAQIQDVEDTGHLLLQLPEGEIRRYAFKEVKYIL